jgi:tetratricopeptide (TPR) repeat protein
MTYLNKVCGNAVTGDRDCAQRAKAAGRNGNRIMAALLLCALFIPACSETSTRVRNAVTLYYTGQYGPAAEDLAPLIQKPNKNYVLNNCRYGSCALAAGQLNNAEQAFLRAYRVMDSVNTNTGSRVLGAVVVYEGVKVWKGQPFERAMAHYYLGLIFLIKGDYENARAAFANSLFKLRKYASPDSKLPPGQQNVRADSNFVLGYFGLGACYMKLGHPRLAAANFQRAQQLNPSISSVIKKMYEPGINALIFVDWGFGPRRRAAGWYGEQSVFTPTPWQAGPIPPVYAWDNGHSIPGIAQSDMVDTLALAQDKRWLTMDTIREAKAVIGTGMMLGGAAAADNGAYNNNSTEALIGLGVAGVGALLAASSQADTRYWEMLPRTVYVIPAKLPPGNSTLQVMAGGVSSQPFTVNMAGGAFRTFYVRLR